MINKPARSIADQLQLLKDRGMLFRFEKKATHFLQNISYYRLKGYWWDMQKDRVNHLFDTNTYFEDVIERYNFDRHLRLILFDAVERIEIALRTKMIYLCNKVTPEHHIKSKILKLIQNNPKVPIYKLGFLNNWDNQPLWNKQNN